jgi:D-glycero-D-manno-heptose 1,7-bisphosphate phosphatase
MDDAPRRAVFLDRDGVVVDDPGYLGDPDQLRLLPGVGKAIAGLRAAGWRVVLITNQSGVARGYFSEVQLAEIHARLGDLLARVGAALDAVYYCPHHPEGEVAAYRRRCDCRKPAPGLLQAAARDLQLELTRCWMVGDRAADVAAGHAAGCRTILVGPAGAGSDRLSIEPTARAGSLADAAAWITGNDHAAR